MSSGFVGRRVELAQLDSICSRTNAESGPAAALISGLPGSGKTRLLAELRGRQRAAVKLSITGYESAIEVPLAHAYAGELVLKSQIADITPSVTSPSAKFPPGARMPT